MFSSDIDFLIKILKDFPDCLGTYSLIRPEFPWDRRDLYIMYSKPCIAFLAIFVNDEI